MRNGPAAAIELYDLSKDESESTNVAAQQADLVAKAEALMKKEHADDPNWPVQERAKQKKGK